MADLVSICIPTYRRPELLAAALESCARQTYDPLEIVVGDDSPDESSAAVVEAYSTKRKWDISYKHHRPSLGQNANVADLFSRARGRRIVLLHDDDTLMPEAVRLLSEPWIAHPDLAISFGKQQLISHEGDVDEPGSERYNAKHNRSGGDRLLHNSMQAALLLQIPNDGYMVDADIAREIGYRSEAQVGVYCDTDFSLRLGAALPPDRLYYIDRYLSQYRASDTSISNSSESRRADHPRAAIAVFELVHGLRASDGLDKEKAYLLNHLIDKLVKGYAISGRRATAARLFLSKAYGWHRRLSPRGLYHLLLIVEPRMDRLRPY
jgi:glycosyltransferase involved in cell wall biosynthesis